MSITQKIINYSLLLLIFLLPWQTRLIYRYAFLNGQPWEYGRLSLYGTEILIWLIVLLALIERVRKKYFWRNLSAPEYLKNNWKNLVFVLSFLVFNGLMIGHSLDPDISYQHALRILGGICLALVMADFGPTIYKKAVGVLWASALVQSCLAVWQFFTQKISANKWLGLSAQDPSDAGVSVIQFANQRWLRAYGSFGWPNSLGIYLAVCLVLGLMAYLFYRQSSQGNKKYDKIFLAGQLVILTGLILSFSRGAWIGAVAGLFFLVFAYYKNSSARDFLAGQLAYYLVVVLIWLIILAPLFYARFNLDNSVEKVSIEEHRSQYGQSVGVIKNNLFLGVGSGAYTLNLYYNDPNLSGWQYQPAHNIYVLWLAENGLIGIAFYFFIFLFLVYQLRRFNLPYLAVILVMAIGGFFDHWLWTLFGGMIFWWLVWGIGLASLQAKKLV